MVPGVLSEHRETVWIESRRDETHAYKERGERSRAFPQLVGPRILSLESVDNFETSDFFSGRKKEQS